MATEYRSSLGITTTNVTLSNTTSLTTLYNAEIEGGVLGSLNKIIWQANGLISFNSNTNLTLYQYYGGVTVSSCVLSHSVASQALSKGLVIESVLAADGSVNSQYGTIQGQTGLDYASDNSTPVGFGTCGVASSGLQDFTIKGKWSAASSNNSVVIHGSSLELLSYVEDTIVDELDEPTLILFLDSKLNNLRYDLRKYAYFYAPLEGDLVFYGYGDVTFTRAAAAGATWRDGASHSVAANEPRFDWSGSTYLGIGLINATEVLDYSADNALHDSNTLCWIEEGVYKSTKRGDTNIFNSSGTFIGTTGKHYNNIVKFNKQLTTQEDIEVETALTQ